MGDFAGAWLRASTGGQDEANQAPEVMRWIDEHGYELRKTYRLHGRSASKGEQQEAIDAALADMEAGLITVLVVWAADRIERRGAEPALMLARRVRERGGRIEYVRDQHLNAVNEMSDVMLSLAATMAKQETIRKRERVKMAHDRSKANRAVTGRPPWGFTIEGEKYARRLEPTAQARDLIPRMFAACIAGESAASISRWMTAETGRPWHPRTIGVMLRNRVYMGRQVNAAGAVIHQCEALVDAATFRRAGKALEARPKRGPVSGNRAMLAGALFCPACEDSPMYGMRFGNHGKYRYYRCTGRGADRHGCGNMVRADAADAAVSEIIVTSFTGRVTTETVIPGNQAIIDAELADIQFELEQIPKLGLDRAEILRRQQALWQREDAARAAEIMPDRIEVTETGDRYSDLWAALPVSERGKWLAANGFRVTADKQQVTVEQGGHRAYRQTRLETA